MGLGFEEMESAKLKAKAATTWCDSVSRLGGVKWKYVMIVEDDFQRYKDQGFKWLVTALGSI